MMNTLTLSGATSLNTAPGYRQKSDNTVMKKAVPKSVKSGRTAFFMLFTSHYSEEYLLLKAFNALMIIPLSVPLVLTELSYYTD